MFWPKEISDEKCFDKKLFDNFFSGENLFAETCVGKSVFTDDVFSENLFCQKFNRIYFKCNVTVLELENL